MSVGNFRGGRKPFPKPSAFESEIHPTHKPSVYAPGISPCRGQIHAGVNLYSPNELDCIYPCVQKAGVWTALLFTAIFRGKYAASSEGVCRTKFLYGCQKATVVDCTDMGNGSQPAVL